MRTDLLTVFLIVAGANISFAQTPNAADGPWSGQMQCVLSVRAPNYQDDQTHTWRIIPGPPFLNGVFRQWPAVWSVQGGGNRALGTGFSETWKITAPDTNAPLAFSVNTVTGQIRIGSQHGLLTVAGAISGTTNNPGAGPAPLIAGLQEWPFPITDDVATATTISGTRTRSVPIPNGWRQPPGVPTTETCTWRFDKTAATNTPQSQSSGATGTTTQGGTTLRSAGGTVSGIQTTENTTTNTTRREEFGTARTGALAALAITVTYPNGGEAVNVGSQVTIRWSHLLPSGTVFTADVSYDGGVTWTPTNSSSNTASSSGSASWTVGGNATTRARIRLRTTDGAYTDQSDADFTIAGAASTSGTGSSAPAGGTVRVTSPNGGEVIKVGARTSVGWTHNLGPTQTFVVAFSGDNGVTWTTLYPGVRSDAAGTGGTVDVAMPRLPTNTARIRVSAEGASGADTSDGAFRTVPPIAVTSPNGGEQRLVGTNIPVTWTHELNPTTRFSVQLSTDNGSTWATLAQGIASDAAGTSGTASIALPTAATTTALIRVSDDAGVADTSDSVFRILHPVTVTSPNGGETLTTDQRATITWSQVQSTFVAEALEVSYDGGGSWLRVMELGGDISSTTASGQWRVPGPATTKARIRVVGVIVDPVTGMSIGTSSDVSDRDFTITQ